jgi:predicted DsbA family dithiol-disulfide isomerase
MNPIQVQVTYDFICPWCWIGQHHLRMAIELAALPMPVELHYLPFELNPDMPKEGVSRQEYRTRKFGSWGRAQAKDAEVALVGKRSGAEFNYDRVMVTPNTRTAHRMMRFADAHGTVAQVALLHEAVYSAYFREGRDIGSIDVLVDLAADGGFDGDAVRAYLSTGQGEQEVVAAEHQAHADGIHAVPNFDIGHQRVSGAQPPALIAQALRAAAAAQEATA